MRTFFSRRSATRRRVLARRRAQQKKVVPGRFTAQIDEPFVVFLIGMRINRFFAFHKWIPAMKAMGTMMRVLYRHPSIGLLGARVIYYQRGLGLIQYWRSFDDLERFARSKDDPHLEAWRRFNQTVGTDGSVGIWHETFLVEARQYEVMYNNMPIFGLAAATQHVPAVGLRETARRRLGGQNEPAVASPTNPPRTPAGQHR